MSQQFQPLITAGGGEPITPYSCYFPNSRWLSVTGSGDYGERGTP